MGVFAILATAFVTWSKRQNVETIVAKALRCVCKAAMVVRNGTVMVGRFGIVATECREREVIFLFVAHPNISRTVPAIAVADYSSRGFIRIPVLLHRHLIPCGDGAESSDKSHADIGTV